MAYSTSNPPSKIALGTLDGTAGPAIWVYKSADAIATVKGADYFSNGAALGLAVGDVMFVYDSNTPTFSTAWVKTVTAGGAASLSGSVTTLSSS
jgi:hypothetical protein